MGGGNSDCVASSSSSSSSSPLGLKMESERQSVCPSPSPGSSQSSAESPQLLPCLDISQRFRCSICLDLVYKPVVQSCGHVFCFWCVHKAMNRSRQSTCPICRNPYIHFARICGRLHFALIKISPQEYNQRAKETEDMEQSKNVFSPRIPDSPWNLYSPIDCHKPATHVWISPKLSPKSPHSNESAQYNYAQAMASYKDDLQTLKNQEEKEGPNHLLCTEDFSCNLCTKFLYRPVVLNCGEVFCEACVVKKAGGGISCPTCGSPHPDATLHVCLELEDFLEHAFPDDCSRRRQEHPELPSENPGGGCKEDEEHCMLPEEEDQSMRVPVHEGYGCDGCGMYPIVGERHCCLDCKDMTGYDLCDLCHHKPCLSGRFNQQHHPDHHMQLVSHASITTTSIRVMMPNRPASSSLIQLNMENGSIQRRRRNQQQQQQQLLDDFDDYLNSFV